MNTLQPRQQRLIDALLIAPTARQACIDAKVPYSTARRWMLEDELFRSELERALHEISGHASLRATAMLDRAINRLDKLIDSEDEFVAVSAIRVYLQAFIGLITAISRP
jgi:hypothetical protein